MTKISFTDTWFECITGTNLLCRYVDMKTIPLVKGRKNQQKVKVGEVVVSDEWYEILSKEVWSMDKDGYACQCKHVPGKERKSVIIRMHRVIAGAKPGQVVDHIDRNVKNNLPENLRITDWTGNARNREPMSEEHKNAIAKTMTGQKRAAHVGRKISRSLIGHTVSEETRRKISETNMGKNYHTKESLEKCRQASIKYWAQRKAGETKRD